MPLFQFNSVRKTFPAIAVLALANFPPNVSLIARAQGVNQNKAQAVDPTGKPSVSGTDTSKLPSAIKQGGNGKSSAYYHFALGHLYEEMAQANGNRGEYLNKAIENYRLTMKEDPSTSFLVEDIAELYRQAGRIREAVEQAQDALKANPDDLNARRVLARIYTQQIGDSQAKHVDENMVKKAIEQYKLISDKDPKDIDSLLMLGRLQKVMEDSVDAEATFKKVLTVDADNEDALTGLAGIYADRNDSKQASDLLEKLTKKNPSPRGLAALASSYEQMHEYGLAADALARAVSLDSTRVELKQALAQDQAAAGRLDDSLKTYSELAESNPQDSQPLLRMSQIYRDQKKFDLARQMNEKAKALDPTSVEVRYNEAVLLEAEGKNADAIASLKSLLESTARKTYNPAERGYRAMMFERLGFLYRNSEQYPLAAQAFRDLMALDPDIAAKGEAYIIDTFRVARDYPKAQQEFDTAQKKYPDDRTIRSVHAQLLADQGKTDLAIAELRKALSIKADRETYMALAEVQEKAKKFSDMATSLDGAEKLSNDKDEKASVLFLRGSMYERQKNFDLAEKQFRQVLDLDPDNAEALNYLGYMFADEGVRLQEARDLIQKAVNLEPNNGAFLDSLGWVYYRLNKLDDAVTQLTHSLQLIAKDPTIHDHLGDVYFKQGKIKDAISQWQSSLQGYGTSAPSDAEPEDVAKVQKKLDNARVRLAKGQGPASN